MKPAGLRRINTRKSSSPERANDGCLKSTSICRICLHTVACIASIFLGFRFSREALLVLVTFNQPEASFLSRVSSRIDVFSDTESGLRLPYVQTNKDHGFVDIKASGPPAKSSRVSVGRHEILIRPWPHPTSLEVQRGDQLLQRVQQEQRAIYGSNSWRRIIAITPTFSRTFQAVHLNCLIHTLALVPESLMWIVVEAGGRTNETASMLASVDFETYHLAIDKPMPREWDGRRKFEARLRFEGLRFVRARKFDGIIVFLDDSNTYSLEFFDEVQKVKWLGALSIGLLADPETVGSVMEEETTGTSSAFPPKGLPIQGPSCDESGHLIGWHVLPYMKDASGEIAGSHSMGAGRYLEWAGFVLNSKILWEGEERPYWIRDWDEWVSDNNGNVPSPVNLVRTQTLMEPLGDCGRSVLLWWFRAEARADSKFPSRWTLDAPLEVVVPSKQSRWPEFAEHPPPLPNITTNRRRQRGTRKGGRRRQGRPNE